MRVMHFTSHVPWWHSMSIVKFALAQLAQARMLIFPIDVWRSKGHPTWLHYTCSLHFGSLSHGLCLPWGSLTLCWYGRFCTLQGFPQSFYQHTVNLAFLSFQIQRGLQCVRSFTWGQNRKGDPREPSTSAAGKMRSRTSHINFFFTILS